MTNMTPEERYHQIKGGAAALRQQFATTLMPNERLIMLVLVAVADAVVALLWMEISRSYDERAKAMKPWWRLW